MSQPLSDAEVLAKFGPKRPKMNRWQPRQWNPKYDQIVLLSVLGIKNNIELAKDFGYSTQQISNILNCKQAIELRAQIHAKIVDDTEADLPRRLELIAHKSVERIESVINNPGLFESKPLEIVSLALKVLQGIGKFKGEHDGVTNIKNAIFLGKKDVDDLREALAKSDEVKRLNAGKEIIQDADSTIVEAEVADGTAG